jgi:hypothetical protein
LDAIAVMADERPRSKHWVETARQTDHGMRFLISTEPSTPSRPVQLLSPSRSSDAVIYWMMFAMALE